MTINTWPTIRLKELLNKAIQNGYSPECPDIPNGRWILGLGALGENSFDTAQKKPAPIGDLKVNSYLLSPGDFLVSRSNTLEKVGRAALFRGELKNCAYPDLMMRFRVDEERIYPDYLEFYLRGSQARKYFMRCAAGTSSSMVKINKKSLEKLPVAIPLYQEQKKIAEILEAWDDAIATTEKLITAKQKLNKALRQKMLLKDEETPLISLGSFLKPVIREVPKPDITYTALGLRSHGKGTFQRDIDRPETISMDSLYKIRAGELIVNITFAWEGAIAITKPEDDDCLVSHRFPMYKIDNDIVLTDYLRYVILLKRFVFELGIISPGGAGRNRVLSKKDFLKLQIAVPEISAQRKIADVLRSSDKEITTAKEYLNVLKKQKRGLMQKLLTGEWPVKVEEAG